jgi:hypothetical protein
MQLPDTALQMRRNVGQAAIALDFNGGSPNRLIPSQQDGKVLHQHGTRIAQIPQATSVSGPSRIVHSQAVANQSGAGKKAQTRTHPQTFTTANLAVSPQSKPYCPAIFDLPTIDDDFP